MIYLIGKRYYGRVDIVRGVCRVQTLFTHGFFFPLYPVATELVRSKETAAFETDRIRIPFSWKSILFAYVRAVSIVVLWWDGWGAYEIRNEPNGYAKPIWLAPAINAGIAAIVLIASYVLARPSARRLAALSETPGLPAKWRAELLQRATNQWRM
jgi:hypothetical protein